MFRSLAIEKAYVHDVYQQGKENKKWYFLSSKIFENAAQPHLVESALLLEKKWSKQVEDFKKKEKEIGESENHSPKNRRKKNK